MTLIMACNEDERRKETQRQQIQIIPGTETTNKYMKNRVFGNYTSNMVAFGIV